MSLKDLVDGVGKHLSAAVPAPSDPAELRRPIMRQLERTVERFRGDRRDDPWFAIAPDGTLSFSPKTDTGQPLLINGKSTTFWPSDAFSDVLARFGSLVDAGAFDDQIASAGQPGISPKIDGELSPADPEAGNLSDGGAAANGVVAANAAPASLAADRNPPPISR